MGIFDKNKLPLPAAIQGEEQPARDINFSSVRDYMVGLSDEDFAKATKVVSICRSYNKQVCEALGVDCEPTSFIEPAENPGADMSDSFLDDEMESAFLDDVGDVPEPKPKAKLKKKAAKSKK